MKKLKYLLMPLMVLGIMISLQSCCKDSEEEQSCPTGYSGPNCEVDNASIQEMLDSGMTPNEILDISSDFLPALYGRSYEGGLIAYINTADGTGFVATSSTIHNDATWGCFGTAISGANGMGIGSGQQNTEDIWAQCNDFDTAARIAINLFENGRNDWWLPSRDEFVQIKTNLYDGGYGNYNPNWHWCSSENDATTAWTGDFSSNSTVTANKNNAGNVIAIRYF